MRKIITAMQVLGVLALVGLAIVGYSRPDVVGFLAVVLFLVCWPVSLYVIWFERERKEAVAMAFGMPCICGLYCFFSFVDYTSWVLYGFVGAITIASLLYWAAPQARKRMES